MKYEQSWKVIRDPVIRDGKAAGHKFKVQKLGNRLLWNKDNLLSILILSCQSNVIEQVPMIPVITHL